MCADVLGLNSGYGPQSGGDVPAAAKAGVSLTDRGAIKVDIQSHTNVLDTSTIGKTIHPHATLGESIGQGG